MRRAFTIFPALIIVVVAIALLLGSSLVARQDEPARVAPAPAVARSVDPPTPPAVELSSAPPASSDVAASSGAAVSSDAAGSSDATVAVATSSVPAPAAGPGSASPADGPFLGAVRGVVREAATGRPIPGAWVAWGSAATVRNQLTGAPIHGRSRRGPRCVAADAEGRFTLERQPLACRLHAGASGYALGSTVPGARDEVVIELALMGSLEVHLRGSFEPPPWLTLRCEDPQVGEDEPVVEEGRPADGVPLWRAAHLAAGRYLLRVEGAPALPVTIRAGASTVVNVDVPEPLPLRGALVDAAGVPVPGATLIFTHEDEDRLPFLRGDTLEVKTDERGRFDVQARPGRMQVLGEFRREGKHDAAALGPVVAGPQDLLLRLPICEEVAFTPAWDAKASDAMLIGLDAFAFSELRKEDVMLRGSAPAGRWILLAEDGYMALVELRPGGGRFALEAAALTVRWQLPDDMPPAVKVRAQVTIVPAALPPGPLRRAIEEEAPKVSERVTVGRGTSDSFRVAPGRALVIVRSDVGRVEREVDVPAGGLDVELRLGP